MASNHDAENPSGSMDIDLNEDNKNKRKGSPLSKEDVKKLSTQGVGNSSSLASCGRELGQTVRTRPTCYLIRVCSVCPNLLFFLTRHP